MRARTQIDAEIVGEASMLDVDRCFGRAGARPPFGIAAAVEQQRRGVAGVVRNDLADEDDMIAALLLMSGPAFEKGCKIGEHRRSERALPPRCFRELVVAAPREAVRQSFL